MIIIDVCFFKGFKILYKTDASYENVLDQIKGLIDEFLVKDKFDLTGIDNNLRILIKEEVFLRILNFFL